jgi:membrane associated rhomboid family serine protease
MIPLGDSTRRPINLPAMTLTIIGVNALFFVLELLEGEAFILHWAFVPADIMTPHGFITIFTAIFLHAGWVHFLGNMLFFWAFAPQIEDVMGPVSFLVFYLLGGVVATLTQMLVDPSSTVPSLGSSGAVAAIMGAFLVTYPSDKIRTVVILGWFVRVTFLPAVAMVGLWFATQAFSEAGALAQVQMDAVVVYLARVGGFVYGTLTCRLFETRRRRHLQELESGSVRSKGFGK